jgi:hypothetical protein
VSRLDPEAILQRLAYEIPAELHEEVYLIGSLAAAYHYREQIELRGVNTKDADLVIQPVGNVAAANKIASTLLKAGWEWKFDFAPLGNATTPDDALPDVRLKSPDSSTVYWIELQGLPERGQVAPVRRTRVVVESGHLSVPAYRFAGVTAHNLRATSQGIRCAVPAMMALANLLAHPTVGVQKMNSLIGGRECLRSAKDLGRVLAFAYLSDRREVEAWLAPWLMTLQACFPREWPLLGARTGAGLRALLADTSALRDAHWATTYGLLSGKGLAGGSA